MAITINSKPDDYSSINDKNWWVVTSDNTSETNFKYVCDVYVGGNLVARLKNFPNPSNEKGIFDVSNVIKNYLTNYFTQNGTFVYSTSGIYVDYEVYFGEEYGGTTYLNLESDSQFSYNYIADLAYGNAPILDGGQYFGYPDNSQFLTKRDFAVSRLKVRRSYQNYFISFLAPTQNETYTYKVSVITYDANGAGLNTYNGNTFTGKDLFIFNIARTPLNTYLGTPAINDNVYSYKVILKNSGGDELTSTYVDIVCENKFEPVGLTFLNSLGGYDSFTFDLVNKQTRSIEKKSYEQFGWEYRDGLMTRFNSSNVMLGGNKTFWNQQSVIYHLISDYVSLTDYYWLRDLIMSPEVYMEFTGRFVPINITSNNWTEKKRYIDKVYNLELDVELALKVKGQ